MDYFSLYASFLRKVLKITKPVKAIFDCSNGTTGLVLKKVFSNYKLLITNYLNDKPDGRFPAHGPDPLKAKALRDARHAIRRHQADFGAVFDADGDRVVFLDDLARPVAPDAAVVLMAQSFKGPVLLTPLSGFLARENLKKAKRRIIPCRVGTYFIRKAMEKQRVPFGAETSGHYYFSVVGGRGAFYFDSGILASIMMLNQVSKIMNHGHKLSGWIDALPKYYRKDFDIKFDLRKASLILRRAENHYRGQAKKISHLDGLKMEFGKGSGAWWFNLRPSNTENLLRLSLEAKKQTTLKAKFRELTRLINL